MKNITKEEIERISYKIMRAAIDIKFLVRVYSKVFMSDPNSRIETTWITNRLRGKCKLTHKGIPLDCELRYDVLVEDVIIVENKSVMDFHPVFIATILSYMEHLKVAKGIIFNFDVTNLTREGQQTFVNRYYVELPEK